MASRKPKQAEQVELSRDRCPNCGGPLKFPERWKEGLCAACGIFVEILPVTQDSCAADETEVPDVATRRETAKFYLESEDLLSDDEGGEAPAESEEAAGTQPTAEAKPAPPAADREAPPEPQTGPAVALERPAVEAPLTETKRVGQEPLAQEPSPEPAPATPSGPESPGEAPREPEPPAPETRTPEPEDHEITGPEPGDEEPAAVEAETIVEPEPEPVDETDVIIEPTPDVEPTYEEPAPAYEVVEREPVVLVEKTAAPAARSRAAAGPRKATAQPRLRDRVLLHVGSVLVAFGGSGLILGSILHDVFRVPLFGYAYEAFGQVNLSAIMFGGVFLVAGLAAIGISLRGGVVKVGKAVRA